MPRRVLRHGRLVALAAALATAGVLAAIALADTATVNTYTYTVPGYTVDPQTYVQTVTVPTVTVTDTVTTTVQATTDPPADPTYASEISYTQTRPSFTPTRTVNVSSATALKSALTNLQVGDLVQASAPFTVSSSSSTPLTINKSLSDYAEIDLTGVTILYNGTSDVPAVQVTAASHLYIFGGDLSTNDVGGDCINDHGSNHVLWWGFNAHDCGKDGIAIIAATDGGGAPDHLDIQGTITKAGQNLNRDPHLEKGTGIHGALLWDGGASLPFTNNRIALDVEAEKSGACVEFGQSPGSSTPSSGNTLILKCNGNPCVASSQTCGNGLQLWGQTSNLTADVKYLEVDNYAGYPTYGQAISSGQNAAGVTVEYGRATNDKTNPYPVLSYLWDNVDGIVYQDVLPAP